MINIFKRVQIKLCNLKPNFKMTGINKTIKFPAIFFLSKLSNSISDFLKHQFETKWKIKAVQLHSTQNEKIKLYYLG